MPSRVTVIQGNSPSQLREELLNEFRRERRRSIGASIWIGPSTEGVEDARAGLFPEGESGLMLGASMFDWERLALHIIRRFSPSARQVDRGERQLLLQEIVTELRQEKKLVYFEQLTDTRGFIDAIVGMLGELAGATVVPEFVTASESISSERRSKRTEVLLIVDRYRKLLEKNTWIDTGDLLPYAAKMLRDSGTQLFSRVNNIFIDGLREISSRRLELLREIAASSANVWVALHGAQDDPRDELFQRSRSSLESIRNVFPEVQERDLADETGPSALTHLRRTIFQGAMKPEQSTVPGGLLLIEAPGTLGEARLVARHIRLLLSEGMSPGRTLFDEGARPEHIVVAARNLEAVRNLFAEVFDEYRIPFDMEGDETIGREPIVMALLRAVRLPEDQWNFGGVTALLRNTFFRPNWPQCADDPEMPRHAEALLRMLGEPRGRENVLSAVDLWADAPPEGLEDEQGDRPRLRRKTELAQLCRPFLQRFFLAWDRIPSHGTPVQFIGAVSDFAIDFGFTRETSEDSQTAVRHLFKALGRWAKIKGSGNSESAVSREAFIRQIGFLAAGTAAPSTKMATGKVRVRSAESAVCLDADYLFLVGLGEKSFPDLSPPDSLLDDADRSDLRQYGFRLPNGSVERLPSEMLLFHRLVSLPKKELILSFASVNDKGQALLPSSFLRAVRDCFANGTIPVEHQRMLIEGYTTRTPISEAETRVRFAAKMNRRSPESGKWTHSRLSVDLTANLQDAARMARRRFRADTYNGFDGWLERPKIIKELGAKFGPEKTFSPTSLEAYVACPFKFFVGNVLGLEALEEPVEEVEASRRGSAFHRALARFHRQAIQDNHVGAYANAAEQLAQEVINATNEYRERSPSDAARVLWELEGKRLRRFAVKYPEQWQTFVDSWNEKNVAPAPKHLESDFGNSPSAEMPALTINVNGIEVRIGGRIDRIDVAELPDGIGYWIIDYKTGKAINYTNRDVMRFEKLQLGLYALAVERVLFKNQEARPLALAYWLVTDIGLKAAIPDGRQRFAWLTAPERWQRFRSQLEEWVGELVRNIRAGHFPLAPRSEYCTDHCHFSQMCRIVQSRNTAKIFDLPLPVLRADEPAMSDAGKS